LELPNNEGFSYDCLFLSVKSCTLNKSEPQNLRTSEPQNLRTSKNLLHFLNQIHIHGKVITKAFIVSLVSQWISFILSSSLYQIRFVVNTCFPITKRRIVCFNEFFVDHNLVENIPSIAVGNRSHTILSFAPKATLTLLL
jgi:hypothetical protein